MANWAERLELVVGLEVHCQLLTRTKLFCGCSTEFGMPPNSQTCPTCVGLPGTLPVLNSNAVDLAIRFGLAVGAKIAHTSVFARKQYFYPDLPKGYQITQYDLPICVGGVLEIDGGRRISMTRAHLEEDAGKSSHVGNRSLVDLNRAGTPLLEIVTEPELRSAEEAGDFLRRLRALVRHIGVSDGNMEEGSLRCDANVSLRARGAETLGTRCEIKNLNSFKAVERAILYEADRQAELILAGGRITQETRLFDADTGETRTMRSKEESHDYRYFPDPDLGPLHVSESRIGLIRSTLPELPAAMASRFVRQYGLPDYDADLLTRNLETAAYFETAVRADSSGQISPKIVANWILSDLSALAKEKARLVDGALLPPESLARLLKLIFEGTLSGKAAKTVLIEMVETGVNPETLVERLGLKQVSDAAAIEAIVKRVVDANPNQTQQFLSGKEKVLGFFVGQIMKETSGKANPGLVNECLVRYLTSLKPS